MENFYVSYAFLCLAINYLSYTKRESSHSRHEVIEYITPKNKDQVSCQVSMLMLKQGKEVFEEMGRQGVMVDWREPDVIRIAPVPLYNTFEDVWRFGNLIRSILNQ